MLLDPRTKLLILAITGIFVFLNESIFIECLFTLIPFLLLFQSKGFAPAWKGGVLFAALLALQIGILPKLPPAAGGILYMFAVYIRKLLPCYMLGSYLIRTTKVSTFLAAMSRLGLPKGFTISLAVTLRYFPTMGEEWRLIKDAMSLRGISVSFPGALLHPMETMEYIYVPMLVSASKISEEITQAALTRGIDHMEKRSCLEAVKFCSWDLGLVLLYAGIALLILFHKILPLPV